MTGADKKLFLEKFRGAIFDLDGTLADSMGAWNDLCGDWLRARGQNPPAGLAQKLSSLSLPQSAEYLSGSLCPRLSPPEILLQWEALMTDRYREAVPLKEGAAELLRSLAARGVRLALASSSFPAAAGAFLAARGLGDLFPVRVFAADYQRDKSFPDIWLDAAKKLALPPGDCVVFEDLYAALPGVRAAGMAFAAVHDPFTTQWEALSREADLAVCSWGELV